MKPWQILLTIILLLFAIGVGIGLAYLQSGSSMLIASHTPPPTKPWPTLPPTFTPTSTPIPTSTRQPLPTPTPSPTLTPTPTPTFTPTPSPTPTPTPRIHLTDIHRLGRLETVEYVLQVAIDLKSEPQSTWKRVVGIFGTDKILLLASGEVVAGVDLSRLKVTDITVQEDRITLRLPPPEIFHTRIDNKETRVYLREKGILYPLDKNLESQARMKAEKEIYNWALSHNILDKAQKNAQIQLEKFLQTLGFREIHIFFETPEN